MLILASHLPPRGLHALFQQHYVRQWTNTAWGWRESTGYLLYRGKIDISYDPTTGQGIDTDIDDYRARAYHIRGDEVGMTNCSYQYIGLECVA